MFKKIKRFLQSCVYSLDIMIYFREKHNAERIRIILSLLLIPLGLIRYLYVSIKARLLSVSNFKCAVTLIVKNEGRYIKEFIDYYSALGCDLIIYDNDSNDKTSSIIKQYSNVEYIYWPGKKRQLDAYNHATKKYSSKYKYMMFFDADEFIVADELLDGRSLFDILESFFNKHKKVACLGINWLTMGHQDWWIILNVE